MNKDTIEGATRKTIGKVEEFGGRALKDKQMTGEGLYDQAAGTVQDAVGRAKDSITAGAASVADAAKSAADGVADGVANIDLSQLRDDLAKLTRTVGELVQGGTESTRVQLRDAFDSARENISQSTAVALDKAETIEADLESRIQKNPWGAVAIAVGVGVLIGKMS